VLCRCDWWQDRRQILVIKVRSVTSNDCTCSPFSITSNISHCTCSPGEQAQSIQMHRLIRPHILRSSVPGCGAYKMTPQTTSSGTTLHSLLQ
jgi:hypothetical protein